MPAIGHEYRAQPLEDREEWYDALWRRIRGLKVLNQSHKDGTSALGTPQVKLEDDWVALDTPSPTDGALFPATVESEGQDHDLASVLFHEDEPKVDPNLWPSSPPAAHHVRANPPISPRSPEPLPKARQNAAAAREHAYSKRLYKSTPNK
jgi:hypothetical protein